MKRYFKKKSPENHLSNYRIKLNGDWESLLERKGLIVSSWYYNYELEIVEVREK